MKQGKKSKNFKEKNIKNLQCWELNWSIKLEHLLAWALEYEKVDRLLVTARLAKTRTKPPTRVNKIDDKVKTIFGKNVITSFNAKGWPGTSLIGHLGRVYIVEFDEKILRKMVKIENELFNWTHNNNPSLPEDICLFRENAQFPVLISVTHEAEGWILTDKQINMRDVEPTNDTLDDMFIFSDKYFCEVK